jgi:outer membrane lipoprotein-sorting protein
MKKIYLLLIILAFSSVNLFSEPKADKIIDKLKAEINKVKDFEAEIGITIDISFVNAPPSNGKIYYKAPNKNKVDVKGFSLLPKQGTGNFVAELINKKDISFVLVGDEVIEGINTKIIKAIPSDSKSEIALSTLWIDEARNVVIKAENTTKNSGSFVVNLKYMQIDKKYWMPTKAEISVDMKNFRMPKSITLDNKKDKKPADKNEDVKGKVTIVYWNYKVNKGVSDDVFK